MSNVSHSEQRRGDVLVLKRHQQSALCRLPVWALLLLLAHASMALGAAPAPLADTTPASLVVPYTVVPGHLVPFVEVRLNGTLNARFLVDTGTNTVCISQSSVQALGLTPVPVVQPDGKPLLFQGKPQKTVPVKSVTFPGASTTGAMPSINGITPVLPDQQLVLPPDTTQPNGSSIPYQGILGASLLRGFADALDPSCHCLTLYVGGNLSAAQLNAIGFGGSNVTTLAVSDPQEAARYFVPVTLTNGSATETVSLALDTGSDVTVIPRATAQALHLEPTGKQGEAGVMKTFVADTATVSTLALGSLTVPDATVDYPDQGDYYPVLGMDILSHYRVLFDFTAQKMYLAPAAPVTTATPAKM